MIKQIYRRIYSDYLMPNRFGLYRHIIEAALEKGYEHYTIYDFYKLMKSGNPTNKKIFIHRHDIDTDPAGSRKYFEIEKSMGIKASYYFRLSTLDIKLMKEINNYGSEVSYHYEELATYCKQNKIKSSVEVNEHLEKIKIQFANNFKLLENKTGIKFRTVASHGDFVNRKLKLSNNYFLDTDLREQLNIEAETYDPVFLNNYSATISDKEAPVYFSPMSPFDALDKNYPVIYLLSHPRQWRTNFLLNTKDNIQRLTEGIAYDYL